MMSENHKKFQSKAIGTGTKQVYYLMGLMGPPEDQPVNLGLDEVAKRPRPMLISILTVSLRKSRMQVWATAVWAVWLPLLSGMATTGICGTGYPSCNEITGIFKQKIVDLAGSRSVPTTGCRRSGLAAEPPPISYWKRFGEIHENRDNGFPLYPKPTTTAVMAVPSDVLCAGLRRQRALQSCACGSKRPRTLICPASLGNYNTAMSKNANAELISQRCCTPTITAC